MTIQVYTTPTCPYCKLVKDYLKEKRLDFEELDVTDSKNAAMEMVKKSMQLGVPVTDIDGEIIIGWNKAKLDEKLLPVITNK